MSDVAKSLIHTLFLAYVLTGYSREEAVGRNCRFLQGPDTNPEDIQKVFLHSVTLSKLPLFLSLCVNPIHPSRDLLKEFN